MQVSLNAAETKLFDTLRGVVRHFGLPTVMRVAGGWVRDKLLGVESHDIDIALDSMMGAQFAHIVNEYLVHTGLPAHKIGVIQSNPAQSKHLETATVNVFDWQVDFVNLRSESYAADSRIPTSIGTPVEDALRRDLTINALFYNINEGKIEDLTGKGLADLRDGFIRTPLHPLETLLDDPLRAMRAVRFAVRYGFSFDPALAAAIEDSRVADALRHKVSRERIYTELNGLLSNAVGLTALGHYRRMMDRAPVGADDAAAAASCAAVAGASSSSSSSSAVLAAVTHTRSSLLGTPSHVHPARAPYLLARMRLLPVVFDVPGGPCGEYGRHLFSEAAVDKFMRTSFSASWLMSELSEPFARMTEASKKTTLLASMLAFTTPLTFLDHKKDAPLCVYVTRDALKMPNRETERVRTVLSNLHAAVQLRQVLQQTGAQTPDRVSMGLWLRAVGELWRETLCVACAFETAPLLDVPRVEGFALDEWPGHGAVRSAAIDDVLRHYEMLVSSVDVLRLNDVWLAKPLVSGKRIQEMFSVTGPTISRVLEAVWRFQLANETATAADCERHLRDCYDSLIRSSQQ